MGGDTDRQQNLLFGLRANNWPATFAPEFKMPILAFYIKFNKNEIYGRKLQSIQMFINVPPLTKNVLARANKVCSRHDHVT